MNKEYQHHAMGLIAVAAIGFAVGFLISDDATEVARLRAELAQRASARPNSKTSDLIRF